MKKSKVLLYLSGVFVLSGCFTTYYKSWDASTYKPSKHTFDIDSVYIENYGTERAMDIVHSGGCRKWIKDSLIDFYFSLKQKESFFPVIPLFYTIYYQKERAKYSLEMHLINNKKYTSLDSICYSFYDSPITTSTKGDYKFQENSKKSYRYKTPYEIDLNISADDKVYGDTQMFFIDYNGKIMERFLKGVEFHFDKGKVFSSYINS